MLKDINLLLKVLFHLCYIDRGISHKSTKGGLSSHILFFGLYITFSGRPSLVIKTGLANIFFTLILAVFFLCNVYNFSNYAIKCVLLSYLPSLTTQLHKTKDYAYFINLFQVLWREGGKKGKMRGREGEREGRWDEKKPLLETSESNSNVINQGNLTVVETARLSSCHQQI